MTPEQNQDAAWAEMEADAATIGLRSATERVLRALEWVARAGRGIEGQRRNMIAVLREAEERARVIQSDATMPRVQRTAIDAKPWGIG